MIEAPSGVFAFEGKDPGFVAEVLLMIIVPDCPILEVGATNSKA